MPMDHVMIGVDANGSCDDRCRCVKMLGCEVILTLNKQGTPTHISATHMPLPNQEESFMVILAVST